MVLMILGIISYLLGVLGFLILVDCVLSILISFNIINGYNQLVDTISRGLSVITRPVYKPFRRILPAANGIDFAPFAALISIKILQYFVIPFLANPSLW